MSFLVKSIDQVGIVVRDVEDSVRYYKRVLGIGPWEIKTFAPPVLNKLVFRGKPVRYTARLAFAKVGALQLELIEHVQGESVYKEFLEERGEGLHHLRTYYPKLEDMKKDLTLLNRQGIKVLQSGWAGDTCHFVYMDTQEILGIIYELVAGIYEE